MQKNRFFHGVAQFCLLQLNVFLYFLGLEYLTEIQDYNPETQPFYKCELCAREKIDPGDIIPHCVGLQHKLKYLVCRFCF